MGCDETREDIEEQMLYTRLERDEIRKQKKMLLEELKLSTGEVYKKEKIPDYVDIEYIKEKKRKHEEKLIKAEVKRLEEKERRERERREEEEKEMEEEKFKEEYIYMPVDMKYKNKNTDLEDVYYLNYVLDKNNKNKDANKKEKHKERKKKKKETKRKKQKEKEKHKEKSEHSSESQNEEEEKEEKEEKYDFIEPVDAKIRTKIGSVRSVIGNKKKNNNNDENESDNDENDNESNSDKISRDMPYVTPQLQHND